MEPEAPEGGNYSHMGGSKLTRPHTAGPAPARKARKPAPPSQVVYMHHGVTAQPGFIAPQRPAGRTAYVDGRDKRLSSARRRSAASSPASRQASSRLGTALGTAATNYNNKVWGAQPVEQHIRENAEGLRAKRRGAEAMAMPPKEYPAAPFYLQPPPEPNSRPATARPHVRLPHGPAGGPARTAEELKVSMPVESRPGPPQAPAAGLRSRVREDVSYWTDRDVHGGSDGTGPATRTAPVPRGYYMDYLDVLLLPKTGIPKECFHLEEQPTFDPLKQGDGEMTIDENGQPVFRTTLFPRTKPSGRHDTVLLRKWLSMALDKVRHVYEVNQMSDLPPEEKGLQTSLVQEAYEVALNEVVRQVTVHCVERGYLLASIWKGHDAVMRAINQQLVHENSDCVAAMKENNARMREMEKAYALFKEQVAQLQGKNSDLMGERDQLRDELSDVTMERDSLKAEAKGLYQQLLLAPGSANVDFERAAEFLLEMKPEDAAGKLDAMEAKKAVAILEHMDATSAATIVNNMSNKKAAELILEMKDDQAAELLLELAPDKAGKVLNELEATKVASLMGKVPPAHAANILRSMDRGKAAEAVAAMAPDKAAAVVEEMSPHEACLLVTRMEADDAAEVLRLVEGAKAAEIVGKLDGEHAASILKSLGKEKGGEVLELMNAKQAAGIVALMDPDVVAEQMGRVDIVQAAAIFEACDAATSASVIENMAPDKASQAIAVMDTAKAAAALNHEECTVETAAEVLANLDVKKSAELLSRMEAGKAGSVMELLQRRDPLAAVGAFEEMGSLRAAEVVTNMEVHRAAQLLGKADQRVAAAALNDMETAAAASVMDAMEPSQVSVVLAEMDSTRAMRTLNKMTPERAAQAIDCMKSKHAAEFLVGMDNSKAALVVEAMDSGKAAAVLEEMESARASRIVKHMEETRAAAALSSMRAKDAADILYGLDPWHTAEILENMDPKAAAAVVQLLDPLYLSKVLVYIKADAGASILEQVPPERAAPMLASVERKRAGELMEGFDPTRGARCLLALTPGEASEVLNHVSTTGAARLLRQVDAEKGARWLEGMDPARAAALLLCPEVPPLEQVGLLARLSPASGAAVLEQMVAQDATNAARRLEQISLQGKTQKVTDLLERIDPKTAATALLAMSPQVAAEVLASMSVAGAAAALQQVDDYAAGGQIMDAMDGRIASLLVAEMPPAGAAPLLVAMDHDGAVGVLEGLLGGAEAGQEDKGPFEKVARMVEHMEPPEAARLLKGLKLPAVRTEIFGVMDPEFLDKVREVLSKSMVQSFLAGLTHSHVLWRRAFNKVVQMARLQKKMTALFKIMEDCLREVREFKHPTRTVVGLLSALILVTDPERVLTNKEFAAHDSRYRMKPAKFAVPQDDHAIQKLWNRVRTGIDLSGDDSTFVKMMATARDAESRTYSKKQIALVMVADRLVSVEFTKDDIRKALVPAKVIYVWLHTLLGMFKTVFDEQTASKMMVDLADSEDDMDFEAPATSVRRSSTEPADLSAADG